MLKLAIPPYDYISHFYNAVASRILQLIYQVVLGLVLFTHQVLLGAINLIALGLVVSTHTYLMRILISRPTTDITGIPPPDHKRLTCQLCSATYLYGPQHLVNPEVLRCQNCDREFFIGSAEWPEETVPISIVHVPVAYMLLSRLRESRWNIFRRKKESE